MSEKECPSCAMQIDEKAKVCPICGFEFPSPFKLQWIAILLLILFVVMLLYRFI